MSSTETANNKYYQKYLKYKRKYILAGGSDESKFSENYDPTDETLKIGDFVRIKPSAFPPSLRDNEKELLKYQNTIQKVEIEPRLLYPTTTTEVKLQNTWWTFPYELEKLNNKWVVFTTISWNDRKNLIGKNTIEYYAKIEKKIGDKYTLFIYKSKNSGIRKTIKLGNDGSQFHSFQEMSTYFEHFNMRSYDKFIEVLSRRNFNIYEMNEINQLEKYWYLNCKQLNCKSLYKHFVQPLCTILKELVRTINKQTACKEIDIDNLKTNWELYGGTRDLSDGFVKSLCTILKKIRLAPNPNIYPNPEDINNLQTNWELYGGTRDLSEGFVKPLSIILKKWGWWLYDD